jgi:hypothetical protein
MSSVSSLSSARDSSWRCSVATCDRSGGSVFIRDDDTVMVVDKHFLRSTDIKLLQARFPHISIDIVSCTSSRSGFMVLLSSVKPYNRTWQRSVLRLVMHCAIFASTVLWTLRSV